MNISKLLVTVALSLSITAITTSLQAAEVHVKCEAGYITCFQVNYIDLHASPPIGVQTVDLAVEQSHTFSIPDHAIEIKVSAHLVHPFGTDYIDNYSYGNVDGIDDHVHYTFGTIFDPTLRKRRTSAPSGFESFLADVESTFEQAGEDVVQFFEDAGEEIKLAILQPLWEEIKAQHGEMLQSTKDEWLNVVNQNRADIEQLKRAIDQENADLAFRTIASLLSRNTGLNNIVQNAQNEDMGSIIFYSTGGGALGVGGEVAMGNAFDVSSLVYLMQYGELPPNRTLMSSFVAVGVSVGASVGGSVGVAIGYDVSTPDEIDGPAIDLNLEGALIGGGDLTVSWDPSEAMAFDGFAVGLSTGANVEMSAGVSVTTVVTQLHTNQLRR